ncbi:MAG: TetR/AcrR family transcriptional regulator [Saprospiraceae bacterium]|nr:TetR/AcrR family transcriptional regulator [Saprospiraceae bacterium]
MVKTRNITERQIELIEAAGKILTRSGVSGLTVKNLATEMQFSEGALYRHFSSKEQIIMSMLEYLANELDRRYKDALSSISDPKQRFIAVFRNQFRFFIEKPHFAVVVFSDGLMEENTQINEKIMKIMAVKVKHLLPILLDGQSKKIFITDLETDELSHIVLGAIRLLMLKWRASNFEFDLAQRGEQLIQSLLKIICDQNPVSL